MTDAQTALAQTVAGAQALADLANSLSTQNNSLSAANVQLQAQVDAGQQTIAGLNATISQQSATIADLTAKLAALQPKPQPEQPTPVPVVITATVTAGTLANAAINAASTKALAGQTVKVPAGSYLLDALNPPLLKAGVVYDFTGAVFTIQPNSAPRYYAFKTGGAGGKIVGGEIIGDRLKHTYTAGSTHEWGYALSVAHDDWTVDGLKTSQCTGDGFGISGNRVTLKNVISTQHRRQGMSVFACTGLRVYDSEFSYTGTLNGQAGTAPKAGVDLEPDKGSVTDAIFERCKFIGNGSCGFEAWMRSGLIGGISGVELRNCTFDGNVNHVWTKDEDGSGPVQVKLTGCTFANVKGGNSIKADAGSVVTVGDSTQANANTFNAGTNLKLGVVGRYDVALLNGGKVSLGWNKVP